MLVVQAKGRRGLLRWAARSLFVVEFVVEWPLDVDNASCPDPIVVVAAARLFFMVVDASHSSDWSSSNLATARST